MSNQARSQSIGTKVTEAEEELIKSAAGDMPLSEWVRNALLAQATRVPLEEQLRQDIVVLMAAVLSTREVAINFLWEAVSGQPLTFERAEAHVRAAECEKLTKAREALGR